MTAFEIAKQELEAFGISDKQIEYELLKKDIDKDKEISDIGKFTSSKDFELLKASLLLNSVLSGAESWSQGDRSEKRSVDAIKEWIKAIYRKYGLLDPFEEKKPIIITKL